MVDSLVNDIAIDHAQNIIEADQVLREIAAAARQPTYEEYVYFSRELGWSEITVREQLRRMVNVLRFQAIAGTTADREASTAEASTAASVLKKEAPKISSEIEKLQSKLNGLERDERLAAKRRDEQNEAVAKLREHVPEHVRRSVNDSRNLLDQSLMRQILDLETRKNELECNLDPSKYPNQTAYIDALQRSFPGAVQIRVDGSMIRKNLSPEWPRISHELEIELAKINKQLGPLQSQYDTEIAKIEADLNYYAR